jgi:uncharacterized protein
MKPLIIYHAHCMDGFGAAFAAWLHFGDGAEYLPMSYGDVNSDDEKIEFIRCIAHREIYILDFSFSRELTEMVINLAQKVIWLDHHRSAFEMWCPGEYNYYATNSESEKYYIKLDNNKSGVLLAWEYFNPYVDVPMLFKIIDDRDRWQFKLQDTKAICAAIFAQREWTFHQWLMDFLPIGVDNCTEMIGGATQYARLYLMGTAILKAEQSIIDGTLSGEAVYCAPTGITGPIDVVAELPMPMIGLAINTNVLISDVGNELAKQSGTFGLVWHMKDHEIAKCSLRSIGDYDVSGLAKCFGGGGHKNAAGFEISVHKLLRWLHK